jgi:hypothetical protein
MRRRTRILTALALVLGLAFAAAPAAHAASAFEQVLSDYQKDGKIDPCAHTENELRDAAGQIPNDIEQYAPDFPTALQDAIDARTQGKCSGSGSSGGSNGGSSGGGGSGGGSGSGSGSNGGGIVPPVATTPQTTPATPGTSTPSTTPQTSTTPAPPTVPKPAVTGKKASADSGSSSSDPPVPFILIAIVAGLILLTVAFFGTTRWLGWDFHHVAGVRQSWGEAGYRAGGTWADFRDWLRNGR